MVEILRGQGLSFDEEDFDQHFFDCWEHDGKLYHAIGLWNMWAYGFVPHADFLRDPPVLVPELTSWLEARGARMVDFGGGGFGPPHIEFPSREVADAFEAEWHIPGVESYEASLKTPEAIARGQRNREILAKMRGDE